MAFNLGVSAPQVDDIVKNLIRHTLTDSALNAEMEPAAFGHGLQRHLIFTRVRIAASYTAPKPPPDKKEFAPELELLLFEEPEAFLHPPHQDVLDTSLRQLAAQPGRQIIAASHSPRFELGRGGKGREVNLWQLLADLPKGNRTLTWKAQTQDRTVAVWYLRLGLRRYMDYPLMGVIKVELPVLGPEAPSSALVTKLSNALLAERTVTPHGMDHRWRAHLYPVFQAERCVKNSFVSVATLRVGLHWPPAKPTRKSP
jgi:hypothetical protein